MFPQDVFNISGVVPGTVAPAQSEFLTKKEGSPSLSPAPAQSGQESVVSEKPKFAISTALAQSAKRTPVPMLRFRNRLCYKVN